MKRKLRPLVFFDVEIEHQPVGRITFELFSNICPRTCENFRCLCTGEKGIGITTGAPLHYKGISFHRMIDEFMLQGGDISEGNGSGGESIYGGYFKDESFDIKHDKPFLLSMANKGPNTNGSQFFITMQPLPHLDGKNVAFGCVVSGEKIIKEMVKVVTDPKGKPLKSCTIVDCGDLNKLKNIKSAKRKRSVGSANVTQKEFSSENQKFKKKKKRKHKKAKKKHKKKSKEVRSDFEERSTFRSSISDEEITDEYETKREGKIASQSKRKSEAGSPVSDKRAKRWTSRSGRKIKGRGALRYHTPSQSRSRSPLDREDCGSNMQPDKGIETPPHWREAQRGQRRLSEPKSRSPMEKIWSRKWEKKSPTNNERSNATSWCSDDDASSKDEQSLSDSGWSDSQIKSRSKHKLYKKATKKKKVNDQNCRSPIDGETFGPLPPPKAWRTSGKAPTAQKNVMKKTKRSSSIDPGPIESRGTCSLKIDYHTSYFMKDEDVNAAGILPHNVVKSRWDSSEEDTACDTVVQNTSVGAKAKDVERVVSGVVGMGMLSKATKHRRHKQKVEKGKVKQRKRNKDAASSPHGGKLNCRTNRRRKKSRTISSSSSSSPDPHYNRRSKIPGSPSGSTFHNNHHLRPSSSASCSRSSLSNRSTSQLSSDPSSWRSSSDHDESSLQKDKLGIHNDNKQTKTKKSQKKEQSKRKGSGLSWQPPLEFGEEDMIDDVLLTKKDKIKRGQQEDPQREYITSTVNQPNITASSFDSASEIGGAGSQMAVDFDADVIDQMLSSALGSSVPVKQKTKNELKKRLMMLKKMGCVGESVESTAGTTARKCKVENAENMECPLNNNTSGDAGGNSDKCTNKLVSNDIFGFGFMPKYQPDKPAYPKEGNKEKKEEEDVVSKTMDVGGIWSDDDLKPKQFETRNVKSQREEACDLAASKSCPGSKVLQSETIKSRHNAGIKETNKVKNDSDSNSDGQLTVGGNLQTTKKPFIFNIKLPKTEARTSEIPSKRKQKKKSKKRKKETRAKADPAPPTPSQVNAPRSVPQTSPVATTTCVDTNAVVTNSKVTAKYTAASNPPPGGRTSVPVFSQAHYYSLPVALPYMHSYHLHYPTSQLHAYMQYHMGRTPVHNYHPFPQEQPPLPEYDEPARPPEPTTDPQRLSDTAVAAMFISSDITDEKLQTLFGDREEEHELPSPASSMTSSHSERRRSRKKKRRRRRSTSSPRSSSRSGRSLSYVRSSSSGRSSYDRGRRRRSRSSYGSSRSTSSRRSYSRHRSRSASYFSATSSSSYSSRSSLSKYSSGSDIDRPCRHYRRRQRRSRTRSRDDSRGWSSGSSYSARGRTRSRDRSSISWSRSPSSAPRSSYSD